MRRHQQAERVRPAVEHLAANTGISTEYGTPTRLTTASSRMIDANRPEAERVVEAFARTGCSALAPRARRARRARTIRIRSSATITAM